MADKHTPLSGPWELVEVPYETTISDWHIQIGEDAVPVFPYKRVFSDCGTHSALITDREKLAAFRVAAAAPELLEALETLLGPQDDPLAGWWGRAKTSNDHFRCEHCGAEDLDCTKLPHTDDCAVKKARAALSKARGEHNG